MNRDERWQLYGFQLGLSVLALLITVAVKPAAWWGTIAGSAVALFSSVWWQRRAGSVTAASRPVDMVKVFYQAEFEKILWIVLLLTLIFKNGTIVNKSYVLLGFGMPQLAMLLLVVFRLMVAGQ